MTQAPSPPPDRLVAAERLHQQIHLITAPTWLLTSVLLGLMVGAVLWSVFGTVLVQVSGRGLLVPAGSRQIPVFAINEARLKKINISIGETVKVGQVLFELDQPSLDLELTVAKQQLADLQNVLKMVSDHADNVLAQQKRIMSDQLTSLDKQNAQLQQQVEFFSKRVSDLEGLLKDGDTTVNVVETARNSLNAASLQLVQSQAQRATAEGEFLQTSVTWQREKVDAQIAVEKQQGIVSELEERLRQTSQVVAPSDGYVSEILVTEGEWISSGTELAIIGTRAAGYEVLAFFSPLDGQRLEVGMAVDITPSTVKREEYGTMEGVVSKVSAQPISIEEVGTLLGNKTLATYLTGSEPPIFARIKVATRPGNPEQFVWRNGSGPPFSVTSGTVTDTEVTVQEQAPISLVLPELETLLGL